jgi:uncharacterized protein (TIGR02246 family)
MGAPDDSDVRSLFLAIVARWNARDAKGFADLFLEDGHVIGYDGSEMAGHGAITEELGRIFADHATGKFVVKVRGVRQVVPGAALLRAVAAIVPPGDDDVKPERNMVQQLLAVRRDGSWRGVTLQTTPAAYHGRPQLADALTAELRAELRKA